MEIGTNPGGISNSFQINLNYLPEQLEYTAANQLTSLKVEVAGKGILFDLDPAGLSDLGFVRKIGNVTNRFALPLADGIVKGKVVTITSVTSAVGAVVFDAYSTRNARVFYKSQQQTVLASSGVDFVDFGVLAVPNATINDIFNVTFKDGTTQQMNIRELQSMIAYKRYSANSASDYAIDNLDQSIKMVNMIPAATQLVYWTSFAPLGDKIVNQAQ